MNWFLHKVLRQKYTIKDLSDPRSVLKEIDKSKIKILFIDDEDFLYEKELKNLGYYIQTKKDISALEEAEGFDVIISDVKGVGKSFKSELEGAFVLNRLKEKYPFKVYAVYSSKLFDNKTTEHLKGISNIKKDQGIEDWVDDIESLIRDVMDPKRVWKKLVGVMIANDVPTSDLVVLEHEFVEVIKDKNGDFKDFPSKKCSSKLSRDVSGTVQSLVAGLLLLPFNQIH